MKNPLKIILAGWERLVIHSAVNMLKKNLNKFSPMIIISGDYVSLRVMLQGRFEIKELKILEREVFPQLSTNEICLDIGANIGNHSVFFSDFFNRVISLEPNPIAFDVLSLNAKYNPKIEPLQIGASSKNCIAQAYIPEGNIGAAKIISEISKNSSKLNLVEFDCKRVDSIIPENSFKDVGFIKVDVEGHEYEALMGCEKIITTSKPIIGFEILREDFDSNATKIVDYLSNLGYMKFMEFKSNKLHEIKNLKNKNYKMILAIPKK